MTKIQPIKNNVLVKPLPTEDVSEGGIVIPESIKQRGCKAKVVAVGNGTKHTPMRIPVGVVCWHIKDAGDLIQENGEDYYLIKDIDILGYLPN